LLLAVTLHALENNKLKLLKRVCEQEFIGKIVGNENMPTAWKDNCEINGI